MNDYSCASEAFQHRAVLEDAGMFDSRLADEQFGFRKGRGCSDANPCLKIYIDECKCSTMKLFVRTD